MGSREQLMASLRRPRYEIVPMRGVAAQLDHLPPNAVVTVTASPSRGLVATMELASTAVANGHHVVPHLSARLIASEAHLCELLGHVHELGIREVFVIAGDVPVAAGPYPGAVELLEAMAALGHDLDEIGISGYPERHPFLDDRTTIEAMSRKVAHATYIVSQICYEPATVRSWIADVRARGIELPIHVGLPGAIDRVRLLKLSLRVGLGESVRYLSKQPETAVRLATGYEPDELVFGLEDLIADPIDGIAGWHLFTFNEVERTEAWRQHVLRAAQDITQ